MFDDSFSSKFNSFKKKDEIIEKEEGITKYMIGNKVINMLNNGNSVNFVEKAVHGYFIHGVLASLAVSAIYIYRKSLQLKKEDLTKFNKLIEKDEKPLEEKDLFEITKEILKEKILEKEDLFKIINLLEENIIKLKKEDLNKIKLRIIEAIEDPFKVIEKIIEKKKTKQQSIHQNAEQCQFIISEILMHHKLRQAPMITNYESSNKNYISRDHEVRALKYKFKNNNIVCITGEKNLGKSQVAEEFTILNNSDYDIIWKFDGTVPLIGQFENFATEVVREFQNSNIKNNYFDNSTGFKKSIANVVDKAKNLLQKQNISYLLIFEDIDLINNAINKDIKLNKYIPLQQQAKKGHIIFTCTEESNLGESTKISPSIKFLKLIKFEDKILFDFLIKGQEWYEIHKDQFKEFISNETVDQDLIRLTASYIKMKKSKNLKYDIIALQNDLNISASNNLEKISTTKLLEAAYTELSVPAREILLIFYSLNLGNNPFLISYKMLEKHNKKQYNDINFNDINPIEELIGWGFIKEKRGILQPIITDSTIKENFFDKINLKGCSKIAISYSIKEFCRTLNKQDFYPQVRKIAEELNASKNELYKKWKKENKHLYCKFLKQIGNYYHDNELFDDAKKYYKLTIKQQVKTYGASHIKVAKSQEKLGYLSIKNNTEEGINLLKDALKIYEKNKFFKNIAEVKKILIRFYADDPSTLDIAKKYAEEILSFYRQQNDKVSQAEVYNYLGNIWNLKANYHLAAECYNISYDLFDEKSLIFPKLFYDVSIVEKNSGLYYHALNHLEYILLEKNKLFKNNSYLHILSLIEIGQIYNKFGENDKALNELNKACEIRKSFFCNDLDTAGILLLYKGRVNGSLKKYDEAMADLESALKTFEVNYKSKDYYYKAKKYIGEVNLSNGEYVEAIKRFEEGLSYYKECNQRVEWLILKARALNKLGVDNSNEIEEASKICNNNPCNINIEYKADLDCLCGQNEKAQEKYRKSFGNSFKENPHVKEMLEIGQRKINSLSYSDNVEQFPDAQAREERKQDNLSCKSTKINSGEEVINSSTQSTSSSFVDRLKQEKSREHSSSSTLGK